MTRQEEETPEHADVRRNTALDNIRVFGISLPKNFFRRGKLTDSAVEKLEEFAPQISIEKIISPSVLGIGHILNGIKNIISKIDGATVKPIKRKNK